MPPQGGRFPGHNLSNPFAHLSGPLQQGGPHIPQQQHQHNLQHPAFAPNNPANNMNVFGHNPAGFQSNAGIGGSMAGAALGAAAGLGAGTGLDGHEARLRFQQGGQLHEANIARGQDGGKGLGQRIREVWRTNLHQEMDLLRSLVEQYPYISMDTEFPGVIARPIGDFQTKASYHYQTVRCNVDILKIIQLGITLFNIEGEVPPPHLDASELSYQPKALQHYANKIVVCPCTWTFNFKFNLQEDMYNEESIQLLKKSGADFEKFPTQGIDPEEFGSLLTTSGLVLMDNVNWVSFHSGYDFAYLIKLLSCRPLPTDEEAYRKLVQIYFPRLLDVKYLWRHATNLVRRGVIGAQATNILNNLGTKSGLQDLADELGCPRIGTSHTAGSDAWLTGSVFWELKKKVFNGEIPEEMNGQMWGLTGVGPPASATAQAAVLAHNQQSLGGYPGMNGGMMYHGHRGDGPSTPTSHPAGLASTPGPGQHSGMMTPGATGAFGEFRYGGK
ncbi:CAF1-domain-containing protein [Westerdykella ornata]|uniref:poly(A)-specific ribonuclease n=1 Tax=Westerdykella ornata TaxID=318751 RepID=A0A6A6JF95_WESOR|nr:CAF1-domain-containing protein [Westerdykella ornata]KAF2273849.1 CAF1-domain-containing protein [Westerdykella ornata]